MVLATSTDDPGMLLCTHQHIHTLSKYVNVEKTLLDFYGNNFSSTGNFSTPHLHEDTSNRKENSNTLLLLINLTLNFEFEKFEFDKTLLFFYSTSFSIILFFFVGVKFFRGPWISKEPGLDCSQSVLTLQYITVVSLKTQGRKKKDRIEVSWNEMKFENFGGTLTLKITILKLWWHTHLDGTHLDGPHQVRKKRRFGPKILHEGANVPLLAKTLCLRDYLPSNP